MQNDGDINLRDLGQKYYGLNICCLSKNVCDCVYFIIYSHIIHTPLDSKMCIPTKKKCHSSKDLIVIDGIVIKYANEGPMAFPSSSG